MYARQPRRDPLFRSLEIILEETLSNLTLWKCLQTLKCVH